MRTRLAATAALVLVAATLAAGVPATPAGAGHGGSIDLGATVPASFTVTPGVQQATVTGAVPRRPLTLVDATGTRIVSIFTDALGQLTFQYVPDDFLVHDPVVDGTLPTTEGRSLQPGTYRVVAEDADPDEASPPFVVLDIGDLPPTSLYSSQVLPTVELTATGEIVPGSVAEDGFGYITTRDGTTLSIMVRLPNSGFWGPGPYPTVVEYSGYSPSNPNSPEPGTMIANLMGFATVGVNIRGTGCSGGVFDVFNAAQMADGYDVIETVARQPWVKHGEVGMVGLSYSGINQLYVAATQPPSLAAITPLSVIEDPWYQQWPGGIYNSGFTQQWLAQRDAQSAPGGVAWVTNRVNGGDTVCEDNLDLRSQNLDFEAFAQSLERRPLDADSRRLSNLVDQIDVPVYLTGAWQDEQTGSRFATMLDDFTSVPAGKKKFTMFNGRHPDGYTPLVLTRWVEFLQFYVDRSIPYIRPEIRLVAPDSFVDFFGVPGLNFEPNRFMVFGTATPLYGTYGASLAVYEGEAPVRVLYESGASPNYLPDWPGAPQQRWAMTFPSWPPPDASARRWYLAGGGALSATAPASLSINRYAFDSAVGQTSYSTTSAEDFALAQIQADWQQTADGKGLSYLTDPLTQQMVIAGNGYVDLWFRSTGTDAGIEVVLSEVYSDPDPNDALPAEEVIVQTGMLRAGYRNLDTARSNAFLKEHLFYDDDYVPLTPGTFVNLQVPIFPVAHPFRAGSRLRLSINTPGADTPLWEFENPAYGATTHDVALGGIMASSLVLPVLPYSNVFRRIPVAYESQANRPPCNSLRGQVCRDYGPLANQVVTAIEVTTAADTVDASPGDGHCATATGACSLRAAVMEANADADADTIVVPSGTYALTLTGAAENAAATGDLDLTAPVTLTGPGATVDGTGADRVFDVRPGVAATIAGLTVTGGAAAVDVSIERGAGGGILNLGDLTLQGATVTGNNGNFGGGVGSGSGTLSVTGSTISNNTSYFGAGALSVGGTAVITSSTVTGNTSLSSGGGLWTTGTLSVTDSTVSGNSAVKFGGGLGGFGSIDVQRSTVNGNAAATGAGIAGAGPMLVRDSTIDANTATGDGGGIAVFGSATVTNATITANVAASGGGVFATVGATATVSGSVVGDSTGGDCAGPVASAGYNLASGATCAFAGTGDVTGVAILLDPLGSNGGPTQTRLPGAGSPALGTGDPACSGTDQRGLPRPQGGACDKGAVDT